MEVMEGGYNLGQLRGAGMILWQQRFVEESVDSSKAENSWWLSASEASPSALVSTFFKRLAGCCYS